MLSRRIDVKGVVGVCRYVCDACDISHVPVAGISDVADAVFQLAVSDSGRNCDRLY